MSRDICFIAHTTWFVSPGWYYFPHDSGAYKLKKGGSVVTFASWDSTQFTIVIETMVRNMAINKHSPVVPKFANNVDPDQRAPVGAF